MPYCRNCHSDVTYQDEGHASGCAVAQIRARIRHEDEHRARAREYARQHGTVEPPREFVDDGVISFKAEYLKPEQREHVRRSLRDELSEAERGLYRVAYELACSKYDEWLLDRAAWDARQVAAVWSAIQQASEARHG